MHQNLGKLYVVATPIGNLDDISQRAFDILKTVSWIAAEDTRHSQILLNHLGISTPLISYHEHNENERIPQLIAKLNQGEEGALISDAGTPLISDPGYLLVQAAHLAKIPVSPIPGPCAAISALCVSGLPTDQFLFEGFLPAKKTHRVNRLKELLEFSHTFILYEAPHRMADLVEDCVEVLGHTRPVTVLREMTKKFESIYPTRFGDLLAAIQKEEIPLKGEFVLVIAGFDDTPLISVLSQEKQMQEVLGVLLEEVSLKQAVQIATKLTKFPRNALYACATALQKDKGSN